MLTHICSIENHPVRSLKQQDRIAYISALGHVLSTLWIGQTGPRVLYEAWTKCIDANIDSISLYTGTDDKTLKKALNVGDNWWKFWETKRNYLIFDCFYLASYDSNTDILQSAYSILKNYCNGKHEKALEQIFTLFRTNKVEETPGISDVQIDAYKRNKTFHEKTNKKVLVVANVSAGKSTLINAITGYRINKTQTTACTNKLVVLHNKCTKNGIAIKKEDGAYCIYDSIIDFNSTSFTEAAFHFNSKLSTERICFADTPGINNAEDKCHKIITEEAIQKDDYDVIVCVSNCKYFGTHDEHHLLTLLKTNVKKPIIFVLNQLDNFVPEEDSISKMLNDYRTDLVKMGFNNPTIIPISAYAAYLFKTEDSLLTITEKRKMSIFNELFDDNYYDFPMYIGEHKSKTKLQKTGIVSLENIIKTI